MIPACLLGGSTTFNIFNLGVDSYCEVNDSIGWICNELGVTPRLEYAGGDRGWIGDNPFIFLDTKKIKSLGWQPKLNIKEGIKEFINNSWTERAGTLI